jgi:hypothetical protein
MVLFGFDGFGELEGINEATILGLQERIITPSLKILRY